MSFQYQQSTGILTHDGEEFATGYSGNGDGLNNPDMQFMHGVGPIPQGSYAIQRPTLHPKLGQLAMELLPDPHNIMHGRAGFFMHGDNPARDKSASEGCIILPRDVRIEIADLAFRGDNELEVIP